MFAQGPSQATRLVAAVILSLTLLVMDHRYHHLQDLRSALAFITYPLQYMADLPFSASEWLSTTTSSRDTLLEQNELLREQNLRLRAELQKYESLQAENMRLRDLVDSSFKVGDRVLVAELSSVDLDPYKQQVIINKGGTSGVFEGQPVLDAHAVMGQVTSVTPLSSTVLLITDSSHALPVQVLRNGLRTIAVGTGRIDELRLPYLPTNSDIVEGDLLVTSGLGGKFPPGYPVATVTRIDRSPDAPFSTVLAQPRAHLDRSREVLLVWTVPNQLAISPNGVSPEGGEDAADAASPTAEKPAEKPAQKPTEQVIEGEE
ncbi:rod shape-determining protein MreC [Thiosocius teredinicola]|uniref:rod shape-determining protein MreC n=1 Tax=Thiosocius teredinicola TaxID=1973002 RepID=UPI002FE4E37C